MRRLSALFATIIFLCAGCLSAHAAEIELPCGTVCFELSDDWVLAYEGHVSDFAAVLQCSEDEATEKLNEDADITAIHVQTNEDGSRLYDGNDLFLAITPRDNQYSIDTADKVFLENAILAELSEAFSAYRNFFIFRKEQGHTFLTFEIPYTEDKIQLIGMTIQADYIVSLLWRLNIPDGQELLQPDIEQFLMSFDVQMSK